MACVVSVLLQRKLYGVVPPVIGFGICAAPSQAVAQLIFAPL